QPHIPVVLLPNSPPALMIHPPVPVQQFPGLPCNLIEQCEVNCVWHAHHPQPSQPPQPFVPVQPLLP
ncbi:hypothetical protein PAXRUDRAFT_105518, partial [Paxillus rubicundulus Ve08.2h10]